VDDNADAARTLALLLSMDGHDVRTAGTAAEGLDLAEKFRPQVLLLDIGLPDQNGYEVARELRSCAWTRTLKIIAITGWGQDSHRAESEKNGIDWHLVKPVDPLILRDCLDRWTAPEN
jgi:DNA-binding response OmpR family regulator